MNQPLEYYDLVFLWKLFFLSAILKCIFPVLNFTFMGVVYQKEYLIVGKISLIELCKNKLYIKE